MTKQKRLFLTTFLGLVLFLVWPESGNFSRKIVLAADPCSLSDCVGECGSSKPYEVASDTCTKAGLKCCSYVKDLVTVKNKGVTCSKSPSEGTENGFLLFKGSIVTCGRSCNDENTTWDESDSCNLCHFVLMAKKIYDLLFSVVVFAAILMITIGGTIYLVSAGNRSLAGTGREMITKTLAGFVLFLLGELIVITVLNFAGANLGMTNEKGKWYDFTCDTTNVPELSVE